MKTRITFLLVICHLSFFAQQKGFVTSDDVFGHRVFIKNNGQFNKEIPNGNEVLYAYTNGKEKVYFSSKGLTYNLQKQDKLTHEQFEKLEHGDKNIKIPSAKNYFINVNWEGANNNISVEESDKQSWYQSYGDRELKSDCFKKITYKNVYDNIDIEYVFTNDKKHGIKYNIIIHPGANPNVIRIKYSGDVEKIKLQKGNIIIKTPVEDITEHSPVSFQEGNQIESAFNLTSNIIGFNFPNSYDNSKEVIIDPWVTSITTLSSSNQGYDVDYDNIGNLFVYGGIGPFSIAKYNTSGTLQWTFNGVVPSQGWNSNSGYPSSASNFIVEKATGKTFMGEGYKGGGTRIPRIDANGIYDNFITNINGGMDENWEFSYDCATNKILALSGGTSSNTSLGIIDQSSGNVSIFNVTGAPGPYQDVMCATLDPVGRLYLLYGSIDGWPAFILDVLIQV